MTTRRELKALIEASCSEFARCWDDLRATREGSSPDAMREAILGFQPRLARAIFRLDEMHRSLCQAKKEAVAEQKRLSPGRFKQRMQCLGQYEQAVEETVAIGKALGDAFAWLF